MHVIYIDGYNFYYLVVKYTPYKWLDFKSLFSKLLGNQNEIIGIKYFTARISRKEDPQKPIRQNSYLKALTTYIPDIIFFLNQKKIITLHEATNSIHPKGLSRQTLGPTR